MTDKERREDDVLKNCIQEAYGISDEQLLAELDEIEATLSDDEFVGVEDRIYEKLMERVEEETGSESKPKSENSHISLGTTVEEEKKVVRIGKRKIVVTAILAAAFVGALGVSTIGRNNYFLRKREKETGIVLNSGKNLNKIGDIDDAYREVEEKLGIPALKMNYIPESMNFEELILFDDKAIMVFCYDDERVYFIQGQKQKETSIGINSDRNSDYQKVFNEWIGQELILEENTLENGDVEYSVDINLNDVNYRLVGILPENVILDIISKLNY